MCLTVSAGIWRTNRKNSRGKRSGHNWCVKKLCIQSIIVCQLSNAVWDKYASEIRSQEWFFRCFSARCRSQHSYRFLKVLLCWWALRGERPVQTKKQQRVQSVIETAQRHLCQQAYVVGHWQGGGGKDCSWYYRKNRIISKPRTREKHSSIFYSIFQYSVRAENILKHSKEINFQSLWCETTRGGTST